MTQLVTVQTDFRDLEQMAQGLVGRVHETHVILPTGESVDEGEWAQFEVQLFDGQPGLAGVGRCVTVVDNGDERLPHQRFDMVLDSLQFDTHDESVFRHILALHGYGGGDIEQVSGVDAESLPPETIEDTGSFVDVSPELTDAHAVSGAPEAGDEEHTMIADADDLEAALAEPTDVPLRPGGEANDVVPHTPPMRGGGGGGGGGYAVSHGGAAHAVQPMLEDGFEEPLSGERIAPTRPPLPGGVFAYTNGIEFPKKPPRPDLEPTLRVTPAPRPAGSRPH